LGGLRREGDVRQGAGSMERVSNVEPQYVIIAWEGWPGRWGRAGSEAMEESLEGKSSSM
jgi:hypothetical protein